MPGPTPKSAARRQRSSRDMGADIGLVSSSGTAPKMPPRLCAPAKAAWNAYWGNVLSGVMLGSDSPMVLRWIKNVDRYYRLLGEADREPVVVGSTGQPRPNPVYDLALKFEASIKDDEKQLGIGPLNRLRLGVAVTESAKSLADLNAEAEEDDGEDDFRVALIDSSVAERRS